MAGWRQAAALATIALALPAALAFTGAVSADEGEQASATPVALQPTQIVTEIPEGYNQLFPLQWGGGSLFQLKSRLATMGCIANTIWNHDGGEWRGYNQYNTPSTLNADWLAAYGEFVPAGSLYASCFDICEFSYFEAPRGDRPCESLAEFRASEFWDGRHRHPIDDSTDCTDDFDKRVKEHVLPSMPLYPDTCIIRQNTPPGESARGGGQAQPPYTLLNDSASVYYPSIVIVYTTMAPPVSEMEKVGTLNTEIHELCHMNQFFHFIEQLQPDRLIRVPLTTNDFWAATTAGNTFIALVGFARDGDQWSLPADAYEGIYNVTPVELAAELCSMYFIHKMGERSKYADRRYDEAKGLYVSLGTRKFDPGQYLTDEIVEWIETWVALPEIAGAETG